MLVCSFVHVIELDQMHYDYYRSCYKSQGTFYIEATKVSTWASASGFGVHLEMALMWIKVHCQLRIWVSCLFGVTFWSNMFCFLHDFLFI